MEIECFLLQESEMVRRSVRRFTWSGKANCPVGRVGYHNTSIVVGELLSPRTEECEKAVPNDLIPHDHPCWPKTCKACGYEFKEPDQWQINDHRIWMNRDLGIQTVLSEAPPGAMWLADWMNGFGSRFWKERGGGPHLMVKTPAGDWDVDSVSSNGEGWERVGEPPLVTVHPSIGIGEPFRYHGFLLYGKLVDA